MDIKPNEEKIKHLIGKIIDFVEHKNKKNYSNRSI